MLLPNANGVVLSLLGLMSAGASPAMINYTAGPANVTAAVRTALDPHRRFVARLHRQGRARRHRRGRRSRRREVRLAGGAARQHNAAGEARRRAAVAPAARRQDDAGSRRSSCSPPARKERRKRSCCRTATCSPTPRRSRRASPSRRDDKLLNVLPVFHSFGLTGGTILPLVVGVRLFLYPSPLHYKLIPEVAAKVRPTIMFGTDTFLTAYARTAERRRFRQPALGRRRRRERSEPRRAASGASASAPRSSKASA